VGYEIGGSSAEKAGIWLLRGIFVRMFAFSRAEEKSSTY
jgi:hypothetical protein